MESTDSPGIRGQMMTQKSARAFGRLWKTLSSSRPAGSPTSAGPAVDDRPQSAFELVTRRALDDLAREVERLETKVNAMLLATLVAVLTEIYKTLVK